MARKMSTVERAARNVINAYVKNGEITRGEANKTIRDGLAVIENTVRENYRKNFGSTFYYAGKVAEAREKAEAARGPVARRMAVGRLLAAEMFAAVFAVVQQEAGGTDGDVTPNAAEEVMRITRETAREVREEARAKGAHQIAA
jgi:polyhydroxyalkanoate synthesis regulator phasin